MEEEPLELVESIPTFVEPVDHDEEEPSLASLVARFEQGLDRRGGATARSPGSDSVAVLKPDRRSKDDALRDALDALQRMAARQR